jgi:hypothetical protein
MVELNGSDLSYLALGDVTLVVNGQRTSFVLENRRALAKEQALLTELRSQAADRETSIRRQTTDDRRHRMNRSGGYWILSDDPAAAVHALTGRLTVRAGDELFLASDGFARLVTVFHRYPDWRSLVTSLHERSLESMLQELRQRAKYPARSPAPFQARRRNRNPGSNRGIDRRPGVGSSWSTTLQ